jgi:hypothetical protein
MLVKVLGIDLGTNTCSLAGLDAPGGAALRRRVRRDAVLATRHRILPRRTVAAELVGAHDPRRSALALQQLAQQAPGGPFAPPALEQRVENRPALIHRAPGPVLHPGDPDRDLAEVPLVSGAGQPAADLAGERLPEVEDPLPPFGLPCSPTVADDMPQAASISSTMRRLSGKGT